MSIPPVKLNISADIMKNLDDLDLAILGELKILSTVNVIYDPVHPAGLKYLLMLMNNLKWNIDINTLNIRVDQLEKLGLIKKYIGVADI